MSELFTKGCVTAEQLERFRRVAGDPRECILIPASHSMDAVDHDFAREYAQLGLPDPALPAAPAMMVPNLFDRYRRAIRTMLEATMQREMEVLGGEQVVGAARRGGIRTMTSEGLDKSPPPASKETPMPLRALNPPRDASHGVTLPFDRR